MSAFTQTQLERIYAMLKWVEDPETSQGYERYQRILRDMEGLTAHPWIQDILRGRRMVRVIDVCSGTGLAGIALSRILRGGGFEVKLTLVDLRLSSLEKGRKFAMQELGVEPGIVVVDVTQPLSLPEVHDIALLWGFTTPHFNPWLWVKVLVNVSRALVDYGVFVYEEGDRVYDIFIKTGFKDVIPMVAEGSRVALDVFAGRNGRTGDTKRIIVDLLTGEHVEMNVYYWDIASSATLTWMFFEDIDFMPARSPFSGFILARRPRRVIKPEDFTLENPTIISHQTK
jgi:SAM-dependent methyltransferase